MKLTEQNYKEQERQAMSRLRVGMLCYLANDLGMPHKEFRGLSVIVEGIGVGQGNQYVEVSPIRPLKNPDSVGFGEKGFETTLMFPTEVIPEDRPWLKKFLKEFIVQREKLREVCERTLEVL